MATTLYVAMDKKNDSRYDLGSVLCMQVVEKHLPTGAVHVQVCTRRDRPAFLAGTPSLELEGALHEGFDALMRLQDMALEHARSAQPERRAAKATNGPPREPLAASARPDADTLAGMWDSAIDEGPDGEGEDETRKLNSDDLVRAESARKAAADAARAQPANPPSIESVKD